MLAAVLYGADDLRLTEVKTPEINDNEILLKTKSAALCGSDIRMIKNGYPCINKDNPRILGHEISGLIVQVGKNTPGFFKEGMKVSLAPNFGCGLCNHCISGNTHLCREYRALGIHLDGGFAEYVKIPEAAVRQGNVMPVGESVSFDGAALNEPLSCVYTGLVKCDLSPGDTALIIGAGPIGMMYAKLALMWGAARVIITDISAERLDICQKVVSSLLTVSSSDLKRCVGELTDGEGADVCIVACSSPEAQANALELTAVNGRINFFGGLPAGREMVTLNSNLIHYKQLMITGSARASLSHFRKTLDFVENGLIEVTDLISKRTPLQEIAEVVALAGEASGLKNIIYFD